MFFCFFVFVFCFLFRFFCLFVLILMDFPIYSGGSSGIGLATAIQCAKEGSAVTLIARNVKVKYFCLCL